MNYCRTCLKTHSLNPIFLIPHESNKYTDVLQKVTGFKIEMDDCLPQLICTDCINFINQYTVFSLTCQNAHKILTNWLNNGQDHKNNDYNMASDPTSINISRNYDDNDTYSNDNDFAVSNDTGFIEFEMSVEDILKKQMEIVFDNMKRFKKVDLDYIEIEDKQEVDKEKLDWLGKCEFCHKGFKSKLSLKNHYKIHNSLNIICEHCGKKFMNKRRLLMHCKAKHGYERTDKCSYCDYRGCNAELVKIHERLHTGEKPYICAECGAKFHRRSTYLQHVPLHLPQKTVQCDECPALFKSTTLMRIHKGRHKTKRSKR